MTTCGKCGLEIDERDLREARHFGFSVAHQESRCIQLLQMRIRNLEERLKSIHDIADRSTAIHHEVGDTWDQLNEIRQLSLGVIR